MQSPHIDSPRQAPPTIAEVVILAAIDRPDGLTEAEGIVMDHLVAAWNAFARLPRQHPDEGQDFADGIHHCQNLLAVRIARHHFPVGWPVKT